MPREVDFVQRSTRHGYPTIVGKIHKKSQKKLTRTAKAKSTLLNSPSKAGGSQSLRPGNSPLENSTGGQCEDIPATRSGGKVSCISHRSCQNLINMQSPEDFMNDWLPHRNSFLFELLTMEAPPAEPTCDSCGVVPERFFRCLECFYNKTLCQTCCVRDHSRHPLHRIEEWNGFHFVQTTLYELGFILHLGHGGDPCHSLYDPMDVITSEQLPTGVDSSEHNDLVIVDTSGFHRLQTRWCACRNHPAPRIQLLHMGLYPGTVKQPRTAFTFQLLEYYHVDAMECGATASNFCNKLRRLTDDTFRDEVQVSNPELLSITLITGLSFLTESLSGTNDCISTVAGSTTP